MEPTKTKEAANGTINSTEHLTVDEYLKLVGQFGRFQGILQTIFCLIMIPATYQTLVMTFVANTPSWQCIRNSSECNRTGQFQLKDSYYKTRCSMSRNAWEHVKPRSFSIVTEWDLVCGNKEYGIIANSAFFVGWAVGAILLGVISDKYGRKTVLFPSFGLLLLAGLVSSFVHSVWIFSFLRFLIGLFEGGVMLVIFVMATELVGPRYRALGGTLMWFAFTTALCLVGLQAWLIPDWRKLMIVITVPYSLMLVTYRYIPESVRWLRVKNRVDDAESVLARVAKANRKPLPTAKLRPISVDKSNGSILDLFRPWSVCKVTLIQWFAWFVNGVVYYGISLASDDLGGNVYRDFVLTSLVEIPGNILVIVGSDRLGRKPTVITTFFLSGLSCIGVALFPSGTTIPKYVWSRVALGMLGKLFITTSFNAIYIWSVELYPTVIRSQGMGCLSVVSRCGAAGAPWVAKWLSHFKPELPFYLMGILAVAGSLCCLLLKETKGMETQEVLESMQEQADIDILYDKDVVKNSSIALNNSCSDNTITKAAEESETKF